MNGDNMNPRELRILDLRVVKSKTLKEINNSFIDEYTTEEEIKLIIKKAKDISEIYKENI